MANGLLPTGSTPFERALTAAVDPYGKVYDSITAIRGLKLTSPPPSFLRFLIFEYGLGELTPYVPNLYELIRQGIAWQRVRGTPASIAKALAWLGYAALLEEPPMRRRRWNLFQLGLDQVRRDEADLPRIAGVAQLSVPVRSVFWRGFHGYDVRALEYGYGRWSAGLYGSFSGIRLPAGSAKWSFGRRYAIDHALTEAELQALGVWIEPVEGDARLGWGAFPWPAAPWVSSAATARSVAMLEALQLGTAWAVFRDEGGAVIGHRRARAVHPVAPASAGIYSVGSQKFGPKPSGATILYLEAMTGFGDGFGVTAASVGFVLTGTPAPEHPPGALWLPPGGLVGAGPILAEQPVQIEFGRTARERVCAVLRF